MSGHRRTPWVVRPSSFFFSQNVLEYHLSSWISYILVNICRFVSIRCTLKYLQVEVWTTKFVCGMQKLQSV